MQIGALERRALEIDAAKIQESQILLRQIDRAPAFGLEKQFRDLTCGHFCCRGRIQGG